MELPRFPDYAAGDDGLIYRVTPTPLRPSGGPLKGGMNRYGYLHVSPCRNGKQYSSLSVHVLVASAFLGPRPDGMHVNHIDGDKSNNRPGNLEYVTAYDNNHHAYRSGLKVRPIGSDNPKAKLSECDVIEILADRESTGPELAAKYGVTRTAINMIRRGETWTHVPRRLPGVHRTREMK